MSEVKNKLPALVLCGFFRGRLGTPGLKCYTRLCFMDKLPTITRQFSTALTAARERLSEATTSTNRLEKVHIVGAGGTLTAAYEQLRNAAENTEEHLLLQRAIRRFYKRTFALRDRERIDTSGEELAIELTHAGYVANDSLTVQSIDIINDLAVSYYDVFIQLQKNNTPYEQVEDWTLNVLAVAVESELHDNSVMQVFVQFAYDYYRSTIDVAALFDGVLPIDTDAALFTAVHRALLKSDDAIIRRALLARYQQLPQNGESYLRTNKQIDEVLSSKTADKLSRVIDRRGAPMRIIRRMSETEVILGETLLNKASFLSFFEAHVNSEREAVTKRINRGVIKSVIFLIITKFIIGIAIEVPYDTIIHNGILWTPLLINLFFPPIYMLLLRGTLTLPGYGNTQTLVHQAEQILYLKPSRELARRRRRPFSPVYNVVYSLFFLIVFGGVAWWLWSAFQFDWLHLLIFFVFLSTASFLGFRLSRIIREIEAVDSEQNGVTLVRDFLYMPFVVVGRWISEKYSKVNIIAMILDMVIELPLKTILRLIRQWSAFISSKKDEL